MSDLKTQPTAAAERLKAETRQFGGLLLALGITGAFGALAGLVSEVGPNGTTSSSGLPLARLIATIYQVIFGTVAMFTGYLSLVSDKGSRKLTGALLVINQLAWLPFIVDMVGVGQQARWDIEENPFNVVSYGGNETDARFIGAMGILAIMAYGTAYLGSIAFMGFSIFAFQSGKGSDRTASYYRGRFAFYNATILLAGFTQLALGSYIISNFGNGPLEKGAIGVAVYVVFFPEISVFVGLVQLLVGSYGIARRFGVGVGGKDDHSYQAASFFMWVCMLSMQTVTQIAYAPGDMLAAAAPTVACITFGLSVLPAVLDVKMRTTPEVIGTDYYDYDTDEYVVESDIDQDIESVNDQEIEGVDDQHIESVTDQHIKSQDTKSIKAKDIEIDQDIDLEA